MNGNIDGLSVTVEEIITPTSVLVDKTITANGEYDPADDDADGYSFVTVDVSPNLEDITVTPTTEEQSIQHGEGYDGIGTVNVNAVTSSIDNNITAENIKKDVEILGVTGSYEGSGGGGNATVEHGSSAVFTFEECLTSIDIPEGTEQIGESFLDDPSNAEGIPFYNYTQLEHITIPDSVLWIGDYAFYNCSVLDITSIGNNIMTIGNGAFSHSGIGPNLTLPNSLTTIGDNAFEDCDNLINIDIPNSVTNIGYSAFSDCYALTSVTIPNSVTNIGESAFNGCSSLTSITIPDSVTEIGSYAFEGCYSLETASIGNSVTYINESTFDSCDMLTSCTFSNSIIWIGDYAFNGCSNLASLAIPNSVTSIGRYTFNGCTSLTSVTIPSSVDGLKISSFGNCTSLESVEFLPITPPDIEDGDAFTNLDPNCTIYVPNGTLSAYTSAANYPSSATYNYVERPAT